MQWSHSLIKEFFPNAALPTRRSREGIPEPPLPEPPFMVLMPQAGCPGLWGACFDCRASRTTERVRSSAQAVWRSSSRPQKHWRSCLISQLLKTSQVDSSRSLLICEIEIPLELHANWKGKLLPSPWWCGAWGGNEDVWQVLSEPGSWVGLGCVWLQLIMFPGGEWRCPVSLLSQFYCRFSANLSRRIKGKWHAWRQALDA